MANCNFKHTWPAGGVFWCLLGFILSVGGAGLVGGAVYTNDGIFVIFNIFVDDIYLLLKKNVAMLIKPAIYDISGIICRNADK